jgi:hypothetical protein
MKNSNIFDCGSTVRIDRAVETAYKLWFEQHKQWLEQSATVYFLSLPHHGVSRPGGFWRGVSSFNIYPRTSSTKWIRREQIHSPFESLYRDWLAVGSDLFAALRKDTILHETSGDWTSDTSEPATTASTR